MVSLWSYKKYSETTWTRDRCSMLTGLLTTKSPFSPIYCNLYSFLQVSPILWQLIRLKTFCNAINFNLPLVQKKTKLYTSNVTCLFPRMLWFIFHKNKLLVSCNKSRDWNFCTDNHFLPGTKFTAFSSENKPLSDTSLTQQELSRIASPLVLCEEVQLRDHLQDWWFGDSCCIVSPELSLY